MKTYRRAHQPGGSYVFTLVTHQREPWLTSDITRARLREALREVAKSRPFSIDALVFLPDHLHAIWTLPPGNSDFSTRWRLIKHHVAVDATQNFRWQPRFWEHLLRDEEDWRRHVDYIHYNPVKHGLAAVPIEWQYSTLKRAVARGWYEPDWGHAEPSGLPVRVGE